MRRTAFVLRGSVVLGTALLLLSIPALAADDSPISRASLKGLKAVTVVVERMDPDAEKDGLTTDQLQKDVESRLRQAGITVVPLVPPSSFLYVNVHALKTDAGFYVAAITVEFNQPVTLFRDPKIVHPAATTWRMHSIAVAASDRLGILQGQVDTYVDEFINAYLEQNPMQ